ncbi:MAG TPA: AAA family ATPase [Rhizobacter sp.]|nr:AAA family ATPase [Rhizobacter sp.]
MTPEPRSLLLMLAQAPALLREGEAPVPLGSRDAALLAWLALEGPTPRMRLAQLLWPSSDSDAARNALRQRLFQLRRLFGDQLVVGHATLALAEGVAHDLADSDQVLGEGPHDFGPELTAWLAQQRERRRGRLRQSLVDLCEMAAQARDYADALSHAHELLSLQPLSEEAHRRVMQLHYLAGDRAAALLAFDRCEQMLKDEVGARPSGETLTLLAAIEAAATSSHALSGPEVPAAVLRPPRVIGRERELAALAAAWQAGQVAALIGEAGMGKTRLLQSFIDEHPQVVRVAGRPGDAGVPFATLARLLRAVASRADSQALALLDAPVRSEIARVLPEFEVGGQRAGEGQRLVLQQAVCRFLGAHDSLAGLVVDDLHFADEASLEMIGALIDDERSALRWALAYRPAEVGSPVQALHDGLVEQARFVPVPVTPLDEAGLAALVDSLALPGVSGAALAPGLLQRTGGNPLFVLETLKQAWVERTLSQIADAKVLPRPVSVGRLIQRRVAQLSPGAVALARVASIAGVDFSVALAEHVLGVSAMQLVDAVNELESAQVLRGMQFAHDLMFEAVRESVPEAIAQHACAGVAAWLEQHGGEPARVAQHWLSAHQPRRALPWLARAAEAAGAALRGKEQIAFLEQQSAIEEAQGDRAAAFASQMLAATLQVTLDGEGGHGLAQCDRLDALATDVPQRIRAQVQRAHLLSMRGDLSGAELLASAALRDALRARVPESLVAECRHHLATSLTLQDRSIEAVGHFEAATSWVDEHGDDERRCDHHGNLALTYDNLGRLADAVPHHELAISLAQRQGHHNNYTMCLGNFAANRILGGHLRDGEALLLRARLTRMQADDASSIDGFGAMLQAICDYQSGRYRAALGALATSEDKLSQFAPGFRTAVRMHLAVCWAHLGQWGRLQQLISDLGDPAHLAASARLRLVLLRYHMDRGLERRTRPEALLEGLGLMKHDNMPDMLHVLKLEIASTHAPLEGLAQVEEIIDSARVLGHQGTVIAAHARGACLAAQGGSAGRARAHASAALETAASAGMVRQYPGELWLHCGQALAAIGDGAAAAGVFAQGRDWLVAIARDEVPEEFRDGFLHRNPVNRELLALAARSSAA